MATISKATGLPIGLRSKSSSCTTTGASERTSLIPPNSPARRPVQRRRVSGSYRGTSSSKSCFNLPPSLEALDLPAFRGATGSNGPIATLVTLRVQVLSYLDDLETRLSHFASSPDMQELGFFYRGADSDGDEAQDPLLSRMDMGEAERAGAKDGEGGANSDAAEIAMEELQEWARDGLEMLRRIREDVCAYLPSFNLDDVSLDAVKARLADLPDITDVHVPDAVLKMRRNMSMSDVMAHLPDFPELPELPDFPNLANMPHMPNMPNMPDFDFPDFDFRTRFSDVKTALSDLDFRAPASYLPTLSAHLGRLQAHLASKASSSSAQALDFASLAPSTLSDLLDRLLSSDFVKNITSGEPDEEDNILERTAKDLARAMKQSMDGAKLIAYQDLPHAWRNNHFVTSGYRFIPLERWPLIILSLFALHNETLNIHTHLIPFLTWASRLLPSFSTGVSTYDVPERLFLVFACVCLFASTVWHTMSGCAHEQGMELSARVDYVGIGWLISASVGTVVYYGFQAPGHEWAQGVYLSMCLMMGLTGSVFPFMSWFNMREYKNWRVCFFLFLAFAALAPLAHMAYYYSLSGMMSFVAPISPSLASYLIGLVFYVTHFPECCLSPGHASASPIGITPTTNDTENKNGKDGQDNNVAQNVRNIVHEQHEQPGKVSALLRWLDLMGGGSHAIWHMFIVLAIYQHKAGMPALKRGFAGLGM